MHRRPLAVRDRNARRGLTAAAICCAACWALGAGSAPAALVDSERLLACAAIGDGRARLSCYDRLAVEAGAEVPLAGASSVSGDNEPEVEQGFGLEARRRAADRPAEIGVTITDRRQDRYDRWIITLDNGQIWRQIDDKHITWDDAGGYRIRRGAFSSFFLESVEHGTRIRVSRMK